MSKQISLLFIILFCSLFLVSCKPYEKTAADNRPIIGSQRSPNQKSCCLKPIASGKKVEKNELAFLDYSNFQEGYVIVDYLGNASKVKLQVTGPDNVTYTYDLKSEESVIPLTGGDGDYSFDLCENIVDNRYSKAFSTTLKLSGISEFGPYLYPNQYVWFDKSSKAITLGEELASDCTSDIDVVSNIYNYIINTISYDYDKASNVTSGYISDVDSTLFSREGICLDYAAIMTAMLRSQSIPTRLEVGYVGREMIYHAWISVYIKDVGWLNGLIHFDGVNWELMDPTFGASQSEDTLKNFISDCSNYNIKYIY